MGILPVLNCENLDSIKETLEKAKTFLPEGSFLHCDIADASFTFHKTWNNPREWMELRAPYQLEVHLMVEHPEAQIEPWIAAGVRRFIVHVEAINDTSLAAILEACKKSGVGVALSSNPETTVDRLAEYLKYFSMFQVLSVHPGLPGQPFLPLTLEKISWLRREYPNAIIEVDGGVNAQTAGMIKKAGADFVVSSSYLFDSGDPKLSYGILKEI